MWRWKKRKLTDEQLDRFGQEVFDALAVGESEINTTAQSPFLSRRLSVRIEAEARRRAEANNPWQLWLLTVRHAIPAMALLAMVAVGSFLALHDSPNDALDIGDSDVAAALIGTDSTAALSEEDLIGWQSK